jgi:hypothetical protein
MALDPEIEKVKKQLESLKKNLDNISKQQVDAIIKSFSQGGKSLKEWKEQLESFRDIADETSNTLSSISQSFTDSVNELQKQNKYLSNSRTITNQLVKSAQEALSVRKGETSINEKSLKAAKERLESQKRSLKNARLNVGVFSQEGKEIKSILDKLDSYEKGLDEVLQTNQEINKELGIAPKLAAGLDKALQKAGLPAMGIANALEETMKAGQEAARAGEKIGKEFKPLSHFTKQVGANLKSSLTSANLMQGALTALIVAFISADKQTGELARNMNLTYSDATALRQEYAFIANSSMDSAINVERLQKAQMGINDLLGTTANLREKDLTFLAEMEAKAGLTAENMAGISKLSLGNNKSFEKNTKEFLAQAKISSRSQGVMLNEKKLMADLNKLSSSVTLSLGKNPKALAEAVATTKALGLEMSQLEGIASGLLDFESSIENELSAQLLTGKNINMELARQYALNNDYANLAKEINKQVGTSAEFTSMNRIQQEAIAKSVGMGREEMAEMLFLQDQTKNLSATQAKEHQEIYNSLVEQHGVSKAQQMMENESLDTLKEQRSNQDKFTDAVQKMKDIFVQVSDALMPIFTMLTDIMSVIMPAINLALSPIVYIFQALGSSIQGIRDLLTGEISPTFENIVGNSLKLVGAITGLVALFKIYKGIQAGILIQKQASLALEAKGAVMSRTQAILAVIKGAWSSSGVIPFVGAGLALAAIAGGMALINSQKMQDGVIGPGGEMVVSGPKGSIQLDKDDSIIAGTNLFGDKSQSNSTGQTQPQTTTSVNVDMSQTNALLQQLITIISAGGDVIMDGQKVGQALNLVAYKTQ